MPRLGIRVRDRITGFAGVVTGEVTYISGCNQALVTPPVDEKGQLRDAQWFDVQRLERTDETVIELENGTRRGGDLLPPVR